jgi:hypothetical protein
MDEPKLVVGCGNEPGTRTKIDGLLRKECHIDTLLAGKVTVVGVRADDPWATLPSGADILLHPSISRGLREIILGTKKSSYGMIMECRHPEDFERTLISRLSRLSLHWSDSVVEMLGHWNHDNKIDGKRVKAWAEQFGGSHVGGVILRSLRIIRANQLLPFTGISKFECFDAIVALTDQHGVHSGSEAMLKDLLEKKRLELGSLEELASRGAAPKRVLILADWLLSGRQFLSYLCRSKATLQKLSADGTRFRLAAARITRLAQIRIERALKILGIHNFTFQEPTEGFLPNLVGTLDEKLDPDTFLPASDVGGGQIISEFELRLRAAGYSEDLIGRWLKECAGIGYELAYPQSPLLANVRPACWGLGDHGLGLTTLSCGTSPAGLLPVLWCSGTVSLNNKPKPWVPLIVQNTQSSDPID